MLNLSSEFFLKKEEWVRIYKHKVSLQAYSVIVTCTDNKENGELVPDSLKYCCMKSNTDYVALKET